MRRIGPGEGGGAGEQHGLEQPGIGHAADHAGADPRGLGELGGAAGAAIGQRRQHAAPRLGEARRGDGGRRGRRGGGRGRGLRLAPAGPVRGRGGEGVDAQRHRQHVARGGQRVGGDPVDEAAQRRRHRRRVERAVTGLSRASGTAGPEGASHTTPISSRRFSGTSTMSPGAGAAPSGAR